jgi:branched-chain amino acid transport system substrate-binding protein
MLGRTFIERRDLLAGAFGMTRGMLLPRPGEAADAPPLRLGVLTDLTSLFKDITGPGSVLATQMAVEDMGGAVSGRSIEVIAGDYLQKPDVGTAVAREWFDERGVDAVLDVSNSAVALSVNALARAKNKVLLATGNITNRLTADSCSPNTVHWTIDAYALTYAPASTLVERGRDTWFFITMDVPSGADLERFATEQVVSRGGRVVGSVKHPLNLSDFAALLLQAQVSKAKVIAFCNGGSDVINAVKQAVEFGIPQGGTTLTAPAAYLTEFHAIGPQIAQGTLVSDVFYWDRNQACRDFARRFGTRMGGHMPTQFHAGAYSATTHYLKAIATLGGHGADGQAVVSRMKEIPTDDPLFGKGAIRVDGLKMHPVYVFQIKTPAESTGEWDLYKQIGSIPADKAWRPMDQEACPLIGKH